jgi:hypothetical protein
MFNYGRCTGMLSKSMGLMFQHRDHAHKLSAKSHGFTNGEISSIIQSWQEPSMSGNFITRITYVNKSFRLPMRFKPFLEVKKS